MPEKYEELIAVFNKLEKHYLDMQDVGLQFKNKLWVLQTRNGKRTTNAAIKIAVDSVEEKLFQKKMQFQNRTRDFRAIITSYYRS